MVCGLALFVAALPAGAQGPEKTKITIGVGGDSLMNNVQIKYD
jgi:hypothetical protein